MNSKYAFIVIQVFIIYSSCFLEMHMWITSREFGNRLDEPFGKPWILTDFSSVFHGHKEVEVIDTM